LECVCSDSTVRRRLEADFESGTHLAGNRTYQMYLEVKSRFETIAHPKTIVDTDQPLEACIQHTLTALRP
jgi:hypothetical protein